MEYQPICFPKDELAHNTLSEWWYFNGHLKDQAGRHFSFMSCLFRAILPKAAHPALANVPSRTMFAYHSILIDIDLKKSHPKIVYWANVAADSFKGPLLNIRFTKPLSKEEYKIKQTDRATYQITDDRINLAFKSQKAPLLEGGTGFVEMASGRQTYYYSLTNLLTKGEIEINKQKFTVTGKSWMDHQWMDDPASKQYWNWFSIQLENNVEIVCVEHGDSKDRKLYATISYEDNRQETVTDLQIIPGLKTWKSPITRAVYPLEWQIKIPSLKANLKITALLQKQEINFAFINYWEGPHKVAGSIGSKKVQGFGYIEIVGRPSIFNDSTVLKSKIKKVLNGGRSIS